MTSSKKQVDRARAFMLDFLEKYEDSRKYVQITVHKFLQMKLVITQVDGKSDARLFTPGMERFTYWMTLEERRPFIVKMLKAGMRQSVIAKCLKIHPSTVHADVRYLREETDLLDFMPVRHRKVQPNVTRRRGVAVSAGVTLQ
jgi:DNA-binding NarL/FixJ family response regulator